MNFKFQIALIAILIGCVAFVSCERAQNMIMDDGTTESTTDDMSSSEDDMPEGETMSEGTGAGDGDGAGDSDGAR